MILKSSRILPALVVLFVSLGCCLEVRSCQPILVNVSEIGTCRGYDAERWAPVGITDTFLVTDERVYLYYFLKTNVEVSLAYRWYLGDALVYERRDSHLTEGYHFSWISPREGKRLSLIHI